MTLTRWKKPKLSPAKPKAGDASKPWYVWFRFFDGTTWRQFRYSRGINETSVYSEKMEAARLLIEFLTDQLKAGWNPVTGEAPPEPERVVTIGDAVNTILEVKGKTLRDKSYRSYKYITKNFLEWCRANRFIDQPPGELTGPDANHYMDSLMLTKSYTGRTFNDHLIVLRTFYNEFARRKWCKENPFVAVVKKKQGIGRNTAFTEPELAKLDKYLIACHPRLYYFKSFIYHCFIRRTELTYIKVKHVDLTNGTIIIPGDITKNGYQESVVIPVGLRHIIIEMNLHTCDPDHYIFGRSLQTCPHRYANPNRITSMHAECLEALEIGGDKGLYSHKHTGVCHYYYATGKDIYALMRQLRHRDLNTTMIYLKTLGLIHNDAFMNAKV